MRLILHLGKRKRPDRSRGVFDVTKTYLTAAFSFEPAETLTVLAAAIWMVAPV
jgi:hypothetical protein